MFGLSRKLVSGKVVDTHYYPANQVPHDDSVLAGTVKRGTVVMVPTAPSTDSWSVTVEGVDKNGNYLKREIYTNWSKYSIMVIGTKLNQQQIEYLNKE